jgi:hypothetical protein
MIEYEVKEQSRINLVGRERIKDKCIDRIE